MLSVKVSTKHQIVVPSEARAALGIVAGDRLDVVITGDTILLRKGPVRPSDRLRGLAGGRAWYGPDAVTFVRDLREASDSRRRDREELMGDDDAREPSEDRARQQRPHLPARRTRRAR